MNRATCRWGTMCGLFVADGQLYRQWGDGSYFPSTISMDIFNKAVKAGKVVLVDRGVTVRDENEKVAVRDTVSRPVEVKTEPEPKVNPVVAAKLVDRTLSVRERLKR